MEIKLGNLTIYDLEELSQKLNCHVVTLRTYIKQGRLRGQKVGGTWFVSDDGLREFFLKPTLHSAKRKQ